MLSLFIKNNSITKLLVNSFKSSYLFSQKRIIHKPGLLLCSILDKPRINNEIKSCLIRRKTTTPWNINSNLANNVILYKYKNYKHTLIHLFGLFNIAACLLLTYYYYEDVYHSLRTLSNQEFMNQNYPILSIFCITFFSGPIFYTLAWLFNARTIKYVILHKGGNRISIVTNNILKRRNTITVPIEKVYSLYSTNEKAGQYMSIKIEPYKYYFLINKNGNYMNKDLFDYAFMCKRIIK